MDHETNSGRRRAAAAAIAAARPALVAPLAAAALLAGAACLAACDDVKPRQPSAARSTEAPPGPADAKRDPAKDPSPGDPGWKSSSALGKARDSAVQLKEKIAQHEEEVSKQADEVFKK